MLERGKKGEKIWHGEQDKRSTIPMIAKGNDGGARKGKPARPCWWGEATRGMRNF